MYTHSQRETTLHGNVVSHVLRSYTKPSLGDARSPTPDGNYQGDIGNFRCGNAFMLTDLKCWVNVYMYDTCMSILIMNDIINNHFRQNKGTADMCAHLVCTAFCMRNPIYLPQQILRISPSRLPFPSANCNSRLKNTRHPVCSQGGNLQSDPAAWTNAVFFSPDIH